MNAAPSIDSIFQALSDDVALIPPNIQQWWTDNLHGQWSRVSHVIDMLGHDAGSILEVGSVPGQLTVLMKQLGYNLVGVDIAPERTAKLFDKYGVCVRKVDVETAPLPFESETFDTVLFTEVLEHLRINPLFALREISRVLKANGRLILSTPNITPFHRLRFARGRDYMANPVVQFKRLESLGHMGHIRLYSVANVEAFLKEVGLELCFHTCKGEFLLGKGPERVMLKLLLFLSRNKHRFRRWAYYIATKTNKGLDSQ